VAGLGAGGGRVAAGAVLRTLAGRCRVGNEGAAGGVHACQSAHDATRLGQRVVAAGIQHHDVHLVLRRLHRPQHPAGIEGIGIQVGLGLDVGVHRDQVVVALGLHAMPGVMEQSDRMRVASDARLGSHARGRRHDESQNAQSERTAHALTCAVME
jgi:hypothetical protein